MTHCSRVLSIYKGTCSALCLCVDVDAKGACKVTHKLQEGAERREGGGILSQEEEFKGRGGGCRNIK